jgi:hypothetical protein
MLEESSRPKLSSDWKRGDRGYVWLENRWWPMEVVTRTRKATAETSERWRVEALYRAPLNRYHNVSVEMLSRTKG